VALATGLNDEEEEEPKRCQR